MTDYRLPKVLASKRRNETDMLEQGTRVELALYRENSRGITQLADILGSRRIRAMKDRDYSATQQAIEAAQLRSNREGFVEHGVMCLCDPCTDAVKRLLQDAGVLPGTPKDVVQAERQRRGVLP